MYNLFHPCFIIFYLLILVFYRLLLGKIFLELNWYILKNVTMQRYNLINLMKEKQTILKLNQVNIVLKSQKNVNLNFKKLILIKTS